MLQQSNHVCTFNPAHWPFGIRNLFGGVSQSGRVSTVLVFGTRYRVL